MQNTPDRILIFIDSARGVYSPLARICAKPHFLRSHMVTEGFSVPGVRHHAIISLILYLIPAYGKLPLKLPLIKTVLPCLRILLMQLCHRRTILFHVEEYTDILCGICQIFFHLID